MTERILLVNLRHFRKHSTGQSFLSCSKRAKKASASLSALPDFLGVGSLNDTPSGRTLQCLRSRVARAEILSGNVIANSDLLHGKNFQ